MNTPRIPTHDFRMPRIPEVKSQGEYVQIALINRVRTFQAGLLPSEELGIWLSNSITFRVTGISFAGQLVVFYGEDADGRRVETCQHHTQVNLTMIAMAKPEEIAEARRVGFSTDFAAQG